MRVHRTWLCVAALIAFSITAEAAPFVVFPKAGELASQDGRFLVRNVDPRGHPLDYVATFHSLFLEEMSSGRTRKLCDYVGEAAVTWTKDELLIMTEYLSKRTSRALIFAADNSRDTVVIDEPLLINLVPVNLRPGGCASRGGDIESPRLGIGKARRQRLPLALITSAKVPH